MSFAEGEELAKKNNMIFLETSAKQSQNVEQVIKKENFSTFYIFQLNKRTFLNMNYE